MTSRSVRAPLVVLLTAAAVVVPSRTESFGLTALEALAAQKPLVTTNVGGLKELISVFSGNGHGLHVRIAEVNPTSDSIAAGLEQVSERMNGETEQSHDIPQQFQWESVAAAYERVLIPQ
jgi:glycosyltransferase involved in cell wall biosynthesis